MMFGWLRRNPKAIFRLLLVGLDASMISLAFYLAYRLRLLTEHQNLPTTFTPYLGMFSIFLFTILVVFFFTRLYHRQRA